MPPGWFLVDSALRQLAQPFNSRTINADNIRRDLGPRWFIHKGHKFVREARHRAADTDATNVGATTYTCHPSAFGHVALHNWPPASQFHKALGRIIRSSKIAYFVVACTITSLMYRVAEEPGWSMGVIQGNHGRHARYLVEQIEKGFHKIVWLYRTSWDADNRNTSRGLPVPAKVVKESHRACGVALHGVNAAIGCAGADSHDGQGFGC